MFYYNQNMFIITIYCVWKVWVKTYVLDRYYIRNTIIMVYCLMFSDKLSWKSVSLDGTLATDLNSINAWDYDEVCLKIFWKFQEFDKIVYAAQSKRGTICPLRRRRLLIEGLFLNGCILERVSKEFAKRD